MDNARLNRIIKRFWKENNRDIRFYNGYCSEFSTALRRFLGGKGRIHMVGGVWHTVLKHNGYYWDVRGKHTAKEVIQRNPIGLRQDSIHPARVQEKAHIRKLLNRDIVNKIVKGLRKAEKEINKLKKDLKKTEKLFDYLSDIMLNLDIIITDYKRE